MSAAALRATQVQGRYRARLAGALAVSLLLHGFMLSLQFGLPGLGLPSLELPSRERRAQASDLDLVIAGAVKMPSAAQSSALTSAESTSSVLPASGLRLVPLPPPAPEMKPAPKRTMRQPPAEPRRKTHRPKPDNPVIAMNDTRERRFNVPAPAPDELPSLLEPEKAAPPAIADDLPPEPTASAQEQEARRAAEETERQAREAKLEAEAKEREAARIREEESARQALEQEATRLEEQKQRDEAARLALQKQQEEAAQRALELEESRREEARLQAEKARREELELQARRQAEEAARQQAMRERERQEAELAARRRTEADAIAQRGVERQQGEGVDAPRRIDPLPRNVGGSLAGRALDQARRPDLLRADPPSTRQADGNDGTRRRSLFGSNEKDVSVMMYAESWRLKIERNGSLNYPRSAVDKAARDPVVSVTIRSDGSVEEVVIHQSSGRSELDEAIHRIVRVNARFGAFPPDLARRFDVIEIRRVWSFDDRLRILEEIR